MSDYSQKRVHSVLYLFFFLLTITNFNNSVFYYQNISFKVYITLTLPCKKNMIVNFKNLLTHLNYNKFTGDRTCINFYRW